MSEYEEEFVQPRPNPGKLGGVDAAYEGQATEAQMNAEQQALAERAEAGGAGREFEQKPESPPPQQQQQPSPPPAAVDPGEPPKYTGPETPDGWTAEAPAEGGEVHLVNKKVSDAEKELNLISGQRPEMPKEAGTGDAKITIKERELPQDIGGQYAGQQAETQLFSPEIEKEVGDLDTLIATRMDDKGNIKNIPDKVKIEEIDGQKTFVINDPEQDKLESNFESIVADFEARVDSWENKKTELETLDKEFDNIGIENLSQEQIDARNAIAAELNAESKALQEEGNPENKNSAMSIAWQQYKDKETENINTLNAFSDDMEKWRTDVNEKQEGLKAKDAVLTAVLGDFAKETKDWSKKVTNANSRYNVRRIGAEQKYNMWQKGVNKYNKDLEAWNKKADNWNAAILAGKRPADVVIGVHAAKERTGGMFEEVSEVGHKQGHTQQFDDMGNVIKPKEVKITADNVKDFGGKEALAAVGLGIGDTVTATQKPAHRTGLHRGTSHKNTTIIDPTTGLAIDAKKSGAKVDADGNITVNKVVLSTPHTGPKRGTIASDLFSGTSSPRTKAVLDESKEMAEAARTDAQNARLQRTISGSMVLDIDRRASKGEFEGIGGRIKRAGLEFMAHTPTAAEAMVAPLWGGESAPDAFTATLGSVFGDRLAVRVGGVNLQLSSKDSWKYYKKRGLAAFAGGVAGEILIAKPISMGFKLVGKGISKIPGVARSGRMIKTGAGKVGAAAGKIPVVKTTTRVIQPKLQAVKTGVGRVTDPLNKNFGFFLDTMPKKDPNLKVLKTTPTPKSIPTKTQFRRTRFGGIGKGGSGGGGGIVNFRGPKGGGGGVASTTAKTRKAPSFESLIKDKTPLEGTTARITKDISKSKPIGITKTTTKKLERQFARKTQPVQVKPKSTGARAKDIAKGEQPRGKTPEIAKAEKAKDSKIISIKDFNESVLRNRNIPDRKVTTTKPKEGDFKNILPKEKSKKLPKKPKETELKSDGGLVLLTKETTEKVVKEAEAKAASVLSQPSVGRSKFAAEMKAKQKARMLKRRRLRKAQGLTPDEMRIKDKLFEEQRQELLLKKQKERIASKNLLMMQELPKPLQLYDLKPRTKSKTKVKSILDETKTKKKRTNLDGMDTGRRYVQKEEPRYITQDQTYSQSYEYIQSLDDAMAFKDRMGFKDKPGILFDYKLGTAFDTKTGLSYKFDNLVKMGQVSLLTPELKVDLDAQTKQDQQLKQIPVLRQDPLTDLTQAQKMRQDAIQRAKERMKQRQRARQDALARQRLKIGQKPKVGLKPAVGLKPKLKIDLDTKLDLNLKTDVLLRQDVTAKPRQMQDMIPRLDIPTPLVGIPRIPTPQMTKLDLGLKGTPEFKPRPRQKPPRTPRTPGFLPWFRGGGGMMAGKKAVPAGRGTFAREIKRDIGDLKLFGGKKKK